MKHKEFKDYDIEDCKKWLLDRIVTINPDDLCSFLLGIIEHANAVNINIQNLKGAFLDLFGKLQLDDEN